jgi:hypothetical protein
MHRASHRSGRISFVAIAGVCAVAFVAVLFLLSGQSPQSAASDFLSALANRDAAKLTDLSLIHNEPKEQIRKDWEQTLHYTPNFMFYWDIKAVVSEGNTATVKLDVTKNPMDPSAFGEHFELSMLKTESGWKVDVPQIPRDMYPFLPR